MNSIHSLNLDSARFVTDKSLAPPEIPLRNHPTGTILTGIVAHFLAGIDRNLSSRVEQRVQNIGLGIVSRWIWTFVQTTRGAAECKVLNDRRAIVFLWTDVVEMERARIVVLRKLTVFTTTVCSFPDLLTSRGRHVYPLPLLPERCSDSRAFT